MASFEHPVSVLEAIEVAGGTIRSIHPKTVLEAHLCWELPPGWVQVQVPDAQNMLVASAPTETVRGFAPNATCLVWAVSKIASPAEMLNRTADRTELPGVVVVQSSAFSVNTRNAVAVRQFGTLAHSEDYGKIETFTRVEIGKVIDSLGTRMMIQRTSSCPVGPEMGHPALRELHSTVFENPVYDSDSD